MEKTCRFESYQIFCLKGFEVWNSVTNMYKTLDFDNPDNNDRNGVRYFK